MLSGKNQTLFKSKSIFFCLQYAHKHQRNTRPLIFLFSRSRSDKGKRTLIQCYWPYITKGYKSWTKKGEVGLTTTGEKICILIKRCIKCIQFKVHQCTLLKQKINAYVVQQNTMCAHEVVILSSCLSACTRFMKKRESEQIRNNKIIPLRKLFVIIADTHTYNVSYSLLIYF